MSRTAFVFTIKHRSVAARTHCRSLVVGRWSCSDVLCHECVKNEQLWTRHKMAGVMMEIEDDDHADDQKSVVLRERMVDAWWPRHTVVESQSDLVSPPSPRYQVYVLIFCRYTRQPFVSVGSERHRYHVHRAPFFAKPPSFRTRFKPCREEEKDDIEIPNIFPLGFDTVVDRMYSSQLLH